MITVAVVPLRRGSASRVSSSFTRTGMRWASRTQSMVGLTRGSRVEPGNLEVPAGDTKRWAGGVNVAYLGAGGGCRKRGPPGVAEEIQNKGWTFSTASSQCLLDKHPVAGLFGKDTNVFELPEADGKNEVLEFHLPGFRETTPEIPVTAATP